MRKEGLWLVFFTALVSGASIFINKFGVKGINPYVFTWLKSLVVFIFLFATILLFREFSELKHLNKKQWLKLATIGLVGGSIPFLLFFKGLSMASATTSAFIHKTMFIYVALLAIFFLKEKLNKGIIVGAVLLLAGNLLLLKLKSFSFGLGELLVLFATLFWAVETIISKHTLKEISPRIVAFGRMFFGSLFILVFLVATKNIAHVASLTLPQVAWVGLTSAFLFLYVFTWYWGLKHVSATIATCILLIGSVITTGLGLFTGTTITITQGIGILSLVLGVIVIINWVGVTNRIKIIFSQPQIRNEQ